jgi:PAS domain S-box-containing protein
MAQLETYRMNDARKTKERLIKELQDLRRRMAEFEKSESEVKQREALQHENAEKFFLIFKHAPIMAAITVLEDGTYLDVNNQFIEVGGFKREEVLGKTSIEVGWLRAEDRKQLIEAIQRQGKVADMEITCYAKDGRPIDCLYNFELVTIAGVKRLLTLGLDITERKRSEAALKSAHSELERSVAARTEKLRRANQELEAEIKERKRMEEALRKSEMIYQSLVDTTETGFVIIDIEGRVLDANAEYVRLSGHRDLGDIRGRNVIEWTAEYEKEKNAEAVRLCAKIGYIRNLEIDYLDSHGKVNPVEINATVVKKDGLPQIFTLCRDITERRQVEAALRESKERYSMLSQASFEGILISRKGIILDANDQLARMLGYQRSELINRSGFDFIIPEDRESARQHALSGSESPYKTSLKRKDGSVFPVEMRIRAQQIDKSIVRLIAIHDITELRRAEEEKQKLEEKVQRAEKMEALGTLAGGVAHDLNNALGVIVGFSQLLLLDVEESNPIRTNLLNILNGSQRAAAIVQDLLTLARRGVAAKQVLNLNRIILDGQNSPEFNHLASYHPLVKIKIDLEPDLLNVSGSSVHLGKTIFNLISNASEAMPKGGTLTIKTSNQYLDRPIQGFDEVQEGDYVVLSVIDTGEGIGTDDLKRIFEPFYTKKVMGKSGTGLGLSVVWGTVKDHQGYIDVKSEEGKGSTFTLYFPVTREAITGEEAAVPLSEYLGRGETLLVVDDVQGQRELAEKMLKKLNYTVTSVPSGEEAVTYLKEHQVDLLVLDMIMDPGMDGLDTYKKILEIHPHQRAIIVSGFSESDRVHSAQSLGAGAYLRKPYVIEKLGLTVRKELDRT